MQNDILFFCIKFQKEKKMKDFYVQMTLENSKIWKQSLYFKFLNECNKKEFLQSQIPFYYAVEAFPRMLMKLGFLIPTSEQRLLLMENLSEEHGHGNSEKFHTTSFMNHLKILQNGDVDLFKNPYIEDWINYVLKCRLSAEQLGSYLAGIEYIYAVISNDICDYMNKIDLISPHYKKHSDLDWEHGWELVETVLRVGNMNDVYFNKAQKDFIDLFDRMIVPTEKEIKNIAQEKVSFFYGREDSDIERKYVKKWEKNRKKEPNIFMVCSGGEHILNLLDKKRNFTVFDVNQKQIEVFKNKLNKNSHNDIVREFGEGKFEKLFALLRKYLVEVDFYSSNMNLYTMSDEEQKGYLLNNHICENAKYEYVVKLLFNNNVLNSIFTDNATKYTKKNFSEHFIGAFRESYKINHHNVRNILFGKKIKPSHLDIKKSSFNYVCGDLRDQNFYGYDIVDISNIGDWIPTSDLETIIQKIYAQMNKGGFLIVRKLLGDYDLNTVVQNVFGNSKTEQDKTFFYSETVIGHKK